MATSSPVPEPVLVLPGRFWNGISEAQQARLQHAGQISLVRPGSGLVVPGTADSPLIVIISGWAKAVAITPAGTDITLRLYGPGDQVGDLPMLSGSAAHEGVVALTPVKALTVPEEPAAEFFTSDIAAHQAACAVLMARISEAGRRAAVSASQDAPQRIAWLLADLAVRHGERTSAGIRIPIPVTQDELGHLVCVSRESVARALGLLGRQGLISHGRRSYLVIDLNRLIEYGAWFEPPNESPPRSSPGQPSPTGGGPDRAVKGPDDAMPPEPIQRTAERPWQPGAGMENTFWAQLDDKTRAALQATGRHRTYRTNMPLCYEGELSSHAMIIKSGWAKVTVADPDGHATLIALLGPGEIVGENGALNQTPRNATVMALADLTALTIPGSRFTAVLAEHPSAWPALADTIGQRIRDTRHRISNRTAVEGPRRLALFLLDLADKKGIPAPGGGIEIPPLSQAELGGYADVSRETTARMFREWRTNGLIETGWRKTVLLDRMALSAWSRYNTEQDSDGMSAPTPTNGVVRD